MGLFGKLSIHSVLDSLYRKAPIPLEEPDWTQLSYALGAVGDAIFRLCQFFDELKLEYDQFVSDSDGSLNDSLYGQYLAERGLDEGILMEDLLAIACVIPNQVNPSAMSVA